jgi:hypothetical protein
MGVRNNGQASQQQQRQRVGLAAHVCVRPMRSIMSSVVRLRR